MRARMIFLFIVSFISEALVAFVKCRQLNNGLLWKVFGVCRSVNQVLKNLLFFLGHKEHKPLKVAPSYYNKSWVTYRSSMASSHSPELADDNRSDVMLHSCLLFVQVNEVSLMKTAAA